MMSIYVFSGQRNATPRRRRSARSGRSNAHHASIIRRRVCGSAMPLMAADAAVALTASSTTHRRALAWSTALFVAWNLSRQPTPTHTCGKIADCCWYRVKNSDTAARKLSPPLLLRRCRLRPITKMLRRENLPNYYDLSPNSLHGFRLLLSELIASRAKTFESSHSLSEYKL